MGLERIEKLQKEFERHKEAGKIVNQLIHLYLRFDAFYKVRKNMDSCFILNDDEKAIILSQDLDKLKTDFEFYKKEQKRLLSVIQDHENPDELQNIGLFVYTELASLSIKLIRLLEELRSFLRL